MEEELKKIYDSEINVRFESIWDGGWRVSVGGGHRKIRPSWDFCDLHEVVPALQELIKEHYPNSEYAKTLKDPT